MKWFDKYFDWLEARPLSQYCAGVVLAFVIAVVVTECVG